MATAPEVRVKPNPETVSRYGIIDPLLHGFEMPLRARYCPLGFPLELASNSADVLEAAAESWGLFQQAHSKPVFHLRIGVVDRGQTDSPPSPIVRAQRSLLTRVADGENYSVSNVRQGFAFAWLTQAAVRNRGYLRWHFLEGVSWDLLDPYITAVHGACVCLGNCGILLCGDSGAGKSSLAFACALRGWTYLADDSCCLVHGDSRPVVAGNPYQIRFRESAIQLFPELKDQQLTRRATGELALEVPTSAFPEIKTTTRCAIEFVVFLNRSKGGPASLRPFSKNEALAWFEKVIRCDQKEIVEVHRMALKQLLHAKFLELQYEDPDSAVEQLASLTQTPRHESVVIGT